MAPADGSRTAPQRGDTLQQRALSVLSWFIGFIGAGAVILEAERPGGSLAVMWAFLLFGWAPVIFVHELGHALAACAAGWRILVFHVAPIALRTQPFRISFAAMLGGPDVAGSVFACPPSERTRTRLRDVAVIAGGPLISLALALALIPWTLFPWPTSDDLALIATLRTALDPTYAPSATSADMMRAMLLAAGLYSLSGFVLSAWPNFGPDGPRNDAAMLLGTWFAGVEDKAYAALGFAQTLWTLGIAPRFWPQWIHEGLDDLRSEADTSMQALDILIALDSDKIDALRTILAEIRTAHPESADVVTADAFVAACIDRDMAIATQRVTPPYDARGAAWWFTPHLRQLALAAIAAASGDTVTSEARLEAVRRASSARPFTHGFWQKQIKRARGAA